MSTQNEKCEAFRKLHESKDAWIIPNPWDVGSARVLEGLGFKALATTSSGFAFTLGHADGEVSLDEKIRHCKELAAATSIPINADFENGFSDDIDEMQANISKLIETGIAGLSIEDYSRDEKQLYSFQQSVERIEAAANTVSNSGVPVMLTARAENLLRGVDDVEDTIARLQAYANAGADVLYAPGVKTLDQLQQVCAAISKPFNVLAPFLRECTLEQMSAAGATRVSVGGALSSAALNPLLTAGKEMLNQGSFAWTNSMANGKEVRELLDSDSTEN